MKLVHIYAALSKFLGKLSTSGFEPSNTLAPQSGLSFFDSVLRGIGQVMLQNNSYTGFIFLVGVFYSSLMSGLAVLLGTVASTATAMLLGTDRADVRAGLFGFNGALVAIALLYFLEPSVLVFAYVVMAAACTTVVMSALMSFLEKWGIPALTAPFVVTTVVFVLACARFGRLQSTGILPTAGLPKAATVEGVVTVASLAEGLFSGIAQVFFQGSVITGIIFAVGLLISSRAVFVAALLGSLLGALVAWVMGAAEPAISSGAFGFNCVLTAIVFSRGFFVVNSHSVLYGLLAVLVTAVVYAAMSAALEPIGMPALTAPFVLTVWLFLLASPRFSRLRSSAG